MYLRTSDKVYNLEIKEVLQEIINHPAGLYLDVESHNSQMIEYRGRDVEEAIGSILVTADTVYDIEVFLNDSYDEAKGSIGFISVTVNRDTSEPIFDKTITLYDIDNLEVHKNLLVEICEKLI